MRCNIWKRLILAGILWEYQKHCSTDGWHCLQNEQGCSLCLCTRTQETSEDFAIYIRRSNAVVSYAQIRWQYYLVWLLLRIRPRRHYEHTAMFECESCIVKPLWLIICCLNGQEIDTSKRKIQLHLKHGYPALIIVVLQWQCWYILKRTADDI